MIFVASHSTKTMNAICSPKAMVTKIRKGISHFSLSALPCPPRTLLTRITQSEDHKARNQGAEETAIARPDNSQRSGTGHRIFIASHNQSFTIGQSAQHDMRHIDQMEAADHKNGNTDEIQQSGVEFREIAEKQFVRLSPTFKLECNANTCGADEATKQNRDQGSDCSRESDHPALRISSQPIL